MKRLFIALLLSTFIVSCAKNTPKVLLFMRDGSLDLEYVLNKEVAVMKDTLERSGFRVVIATLDGSTLSAGTTRMKAEIRLADVNVADYAGFIMPCMAAGDTTDPKISAESVALVKKAISAGKPVAAQTGSVWVLAEAGVLKGKKYAERQEVQHPYFAGAIYGGTGVVRDGLILTSGICPYVARVNKSNDGTRQLTLALVEVMKGNK